MTSPSLPVEPGASHGEPKSPEPGDGRWKSRHSGTTGFCMIVTVLHLTKGRQSHEMEQMTKEKPKHVFSATTC